MKRPLSPDRASSSRHPRSAFRTAPIRGAMPVYTGPAIPGANGFLSPTRLSIAIIVMAEGSDGGSHGGIGRIGSRDAGRAPGAVLRTFVRPPSGQPAALRFGYPLCRGHYVGRLDADASGEPDCRQTLVPLRHADAARGRVVERRCTGRPLGEPRLVERLIHRNDISGPSA